MENQTQKENLELSDDFTTYIESMEVWEKSQRNLMAGHDLDLAYETKSLELAKESIEILKKRQQKESAFYDDTMRRFHTYLSDRDLPIPEWAK